MALDATFKAALEGQAPLIFYAVEIILDTDSPGSTIRLLDGAGFCTFSSKTFTGRDSTFGTLEFQEALTDGIGDEVPHVTFAIHPPTITAAIRLASPAAQGRAVSVWMGAMDPATGLVIGSPDLMFTGEIDVPTLKIGEGTRSVEIDCCSIWERLFETDEGLGLTNASHQSIWPGELGFEMVTELDRQVPWGADAPRPGIVAGQSSTAAASVAALIQARQTAYS